MHKARRNRNRSKRERSGQVAMPLLNAELFAEIGLGPTLTTTEPSPCKQTHRILYIITIHSVAKFYPTNRAHGHCT